MHVTYEEAKEESGPRDNLSQDLFWGMKHISERLSKTIWVLPKHICSNMKSHNKLKYVG